MRLAVWRRLIVLMGLAALLSAGLAGSGDAAGTSATVPLTVKEFAFVPKAVTVGAAPTSFAITNGGMIEHDFAIDALKVKTPLIKPGQKMTVLVALKPAGTRGP